MKQLLFFILLFSCFNAFGQQLTGVVTDKITGLPVNGALITWGGSKAVSDANGKFELDNPGVNDTLRAVSFTYKQYALLVNSSAAFIKIDLQPKVNALSEVIIRSGRNFKQDSMSNRLAYAKEFNYTGPKFKDAFAGSQSPGRAYGQMVTVNPLLLIAALTKKSTPKYKLQKRLVGDEQDDYVSRRFTKGIIRQLTHLEGDTLSTFVIKYKPSYIEIKKLSDYEIQVYIKERFKTFVRDGYPVSNPFILANADSTKR